MMQTGIYRWLPLVRLNKFCHNLATLNCGNPVILVCFG